MKGYITIFLEMAVVVALLLLLLCSSCTTTKYVPVETVRTDTLWRNHTAHDSIYLHDSTYVFEKGDTYYVERWHAKYTLKEIHDTTYVSKTDSIAVPYPVEKELSWWSRKKIEFGELAMVIIAGLLIFLVIKIKLR